VIAIIDNYDSFTYNLVQAIGELGGDPQVYRNDEVTAEAVEAARPEGLIISPGPKTPKEAGVSNDVLKRMAGHVPVLGVCLGHQCLGAVYGGEIVRAERILHGKTSQIIHQGRGLFAGIDNPFPATRYHSLVVRRESLPAVLEVVAWTAEGEIMALKHREHETWGVQFHPESILTEQGPKLLRNFLTLCRSKAAAAAR